MPNPYTDGAESITQAEHISPTKTGDGIAAKRVAVYETLDGVTWSRAGTQLALRIDDTTTANVTYVGKAAIGTATDAAAWQIHKLDETSGLIQTWADGDANFDNVWDNRAGLSYS